MSVTAQLLAECAGHIKYLTALEHVITSPGQFVGDRLFGHQNM